MHTIFDLCSTKSTGKSTIRSRRRGKKMLTYLLALNALTFCVARYGFWEHQGKVGAVLEVIKPAGESGIMNYYVAGCVNQPKAAFEFMVNDLEGGVTYVNYVNRGCDMKMIAEQVIADAREHGYKARVIGISIGDYVSRWAEHEIGAETIAINPEPDASLLQPWARYASVAGGAVAKLGAAACGWASLIPFYPSVGGKHSLSFIADQFYGIGTANDAPHSTERTLGVINSDEDQFLDNVEIERYFEGVPVEYAESDHGNTVDKAPAYIEAWSALRAVIGL